MRIIAGVLLLAVFAAALLPSVPARLLSHVVPPDQVIMQGFSGTLWRGSASRVMLRLPAGYLHLGRVSWSLSPLSLLALAPRVHLRSEWGQQTLDTDLVLHGARDVSLGDLDARVDADLLRQFAPLALSGTFSARFQTLELRDGLPRTASGRVVWERGAWASPRGPVPLGSFALEVAQPPGEPLRGEIVTLAGPLEAGGSVGLDGRRYELDILVRADGALGPQLDNALSLLAARGPDGYHIRMDGELE